MVSFLSRGRVWDLKAATELMLSLGMADSRRTSERMLHRAGVLPDELAPDLLRDENSRAPNRLVLDWQISEAKRKRHRILFAQLHRGGSGEFYLHLNDARGGRFWVVLDPQKDLLSETSNAFRLAFDEFQRQLLIFPSGELVGICRKLKESDQYGVSLISFAVGEDEFIRPTVDFNSNKLSPNLKRLEAESIHIFREALSDAENPVMLHSIGKDSAVMLHLAKKAFYPGKPPFPLLHVDTRWKFQEMYQFRDRIASESGMNMLIHVNPEAIERNINPFDHGSAVHTDITKTEGLKQALDQNGFDVIFGGARRDEEKSRAKERIFSFRTTSHRWEPKNQRPELWSLYNTRKAKGESIRVFPLSNWTELDVWHYILLENIPVVPLYFAKDRPVVVRNGMIILVDDDRMKLLPGEAIEAKKVRFRTLGCYPLTGGVESDADDLPSIIMELLSSRHSEREGRAIDKDSSGSMERKKQEGYF